MSKAVLLKVKSRRHLISTANGMALKIYAFINPRGPVPDMIDEGIL